MRSLLLSLLSFWFIVSGALAAPNVPFFCVDDRNDWVGCLGNGSVKTPNMYPLDESETPPVLEGDVDDLPAIARKRAVDRSSKHDQVVALGEWEKAIQGHNACISFADAQIGRVLDALDASPHKDDTIIVLWSDHGYHLGGKGHWHKRTLWERSTHVPLIFVAPGVMDPGSVCDNPVDLMALYPTLVELAGLPKVTYEESLRPFLI